MKICILSDSHDHIALLDTAVAEAKALGAEAVIHCGDVVAPSSLHAVQKHGVPVHVIHGNNAGDLFTLGCLASQPHSLTHYYGMDAELVLVDKRIFMVHYPHYARAMAATGDWDLVCCGHSHRVTVESVPNLKGGTTPLVDPGTVGGVGRAPSTWVMADLATMEFDVYDVDKRLERRGAA